MSFKIFVFLQAEEEDGQTMIAFDQYDFVPDASW
jgi:hypothetical protein